MLMNKYFGALFFHYVRLPFLTGPPFSRNRPPKSDPKTPSLPHLTRKFLLEVLCQQCSLQKSVD
jgi:hypothetical protein